MNIKKYLKNAYECIYETIKIGIIYKLLGSIFTALFFYFNIELVKRSILLFDSDFSYTIKILSHTFVFGPIVSGVICLMSVIVCSVIFKISGDFCMSRGIVKTFTVIQNELINLLQKTDMSFYIDNSYGVVSDVFSRHLNMIEQINNIMFLELLPGSIAFMAVLYDMIPSLRNVLIVFAIIFVIISFIVKSWSFDIVKKQGEYSSSKYNNIVDLITSAFTTKIFKTDNFTYDRVSNSIIKEMNNKMKYIFFSNTFPNVLFSMGALFMAPISIYCLSLVFDSSKIAVEYNAFSRIMLLFGMRIGVFNKTTTLMSELDQTISVFNKMTFENDVGTKEIEDIQSIEIRNLEYTINDIPIFKDFSIDIQMGDRVLIMGSSGIGKTTLLNILEKFLRVKNNSIFIKSKNGTSYDINDISNSSLYEHFVYITQDAHLFSGSLRDNVAMGRDIKEEDIVRSLKEAELLEKLEEIGLDTKIDKLSGGQRQRLSSARFFIKKYSVALLDEITSGLDSRNSLKILSTILNKYEQNNKEMIILAVSHDISWVRYFNKILFVEKDCKYLLGTHDELYAKSKDYQDFFGIDGYN